MVEFNLWEKEGATKIVWHQPKEMPGAGRESVRFCPFRTEHVQFASMASRLIPVWAVLRDGMRCRWSAGSVFRFRFLPTD